MVKKSSIGDIARLAGVSKTTVSLVLNNKYVESRIGHETVKKVQDIVKELGFVPNEHARSFRLKKTKTIGLIVGDLTNYYFSKIESVIERVARSHGYSVVIAGTNEEIENQKTIVSIMSNKSVDGLIIASATSSLSGKDIGQFSLPVVFFDRKVANKSSVQISSDNVESVKKMIAGWFSTGCKKIAFIGGDDGVSTQADRFSGYKAACKEVGIKYIEEVVYNGDFSEEWGYNSAKKLVASGQKIDGLFTASLTLLQGVVRYFREYDINWLDTVRLGTFDNHPLLDAFRWNVDSIEQSYEEIGDSAFRALLDIIEGRTPDSKLSIPCNLIYRNK